MMNRMVMKFHAKIFLVLALALLGIATSSVYARDIKLPYSPGQHEWSVGDGDLILMSAIYTNQISFDVRAYTFYYQPRGEKPIYIVPFAEKGKKTSFTYITSSGGDWLLSDLIVHKIKKKIILIKAQQATPDGFSSPGDLTVEYYELRQSDNDVPYYFELTSKYTIPQANRLSVDEVLNSDLNRLKSSNQK